MIHIPATPLCTVCWEPGRYLTVCDICFGDVHERYCGTAQKVYRKDGSVERWYECNSCGDGLV